MIAKGSQRGGSGQLARHLMNDRDNDHVELHEIRGLDSRNLLAAFREIEAAAQATRCKQPFFHVSFSPPADAAVNYDQFEMAFAAVEDKYPQLAELPRAVVFHEKDGRRHAHVVWSRIDTEQGRALNLSHFKLKLRDVSRSMYQALDLPLPKGLADSKERSKTNFDRREWQQAKRLEEDPRDLKKIVMESLARSDNRTALEHALAQHALFLARGDRRGYVLVHHSGDILSLSRVSGLKSKELAARIGDPATLPTASQVQDSMRERAAEAIRKRLAEAKARQRVQLKPLQEQLLEMRMRHRAARAALERAQEARWQREELARANRLRKGIMGLWDRLSGRRGKVSEANAREAAAGRTRDRDEKQTLIDIHLAERRLMKQDITNIRRAQEGERRQLRAELGAILSPAVAESRTSLRDTFREKAEPENTEKTPPGEGRARKRGGPDDGRGFGQ